MKLTDYPFLMIVLCVLILLPSQGKDDSQNKIVGGMPSYFRQGYKQVIIEKVILKKFNGDFSRRNGDWMVRYRAYQASGGSAIPGDRGIEIVFFDQIAYQSCMQALAKGSPVTVVGYETFLLLPIIDSQVYQRLGRDEKNIGNICILRRIFVVLRVTDKRNNEHM